MQASIDKTRWKMMIDVGNHILSAGGSIYGGFVRDRIIHDHHADHFYENVNNQGYTFKHIQDLYADRNFLPEHVDRCLLPHDIDCFISDRNLVNFLKSLSKEYTIKVKRSAPANIYFGTHSGCSLLLHSKISVTFKVHKILKATVDLRPYTVDLDVIHAHESVNIYKELSRNFDFECNSLIITPQNEFQLSHSISEFMNPFEKIKKIESIIADIRNKKAVMVNNPDSTTGVPHHRIVKMILKGFRLESMSFEVMTEKYEGYCIICHAEIDEKKHHIKDRNCDARCHSKCFIRMVEHEHFKNECAICKCQCFVSSEEKKAIAIVSDLEDILELGNQNRE